MRSMKLLWGLDALLILSGLGWLASAAFYHPSYVAFHQSVSPYFPGLITILYGLYQGLRLYRGKRVLRANKNGTQGIIFKV